MSNLIDREALMADIDQSVVFSVRTGKPSLEIRGANKIIDRIKNATAVNAVQVVRCMDCKHYDPDAMICKFWPDEGYREPGHFCAKGERR